MDYEELRPFVLEVLKQQESTQILNVLNAVENLAISKGFYTDAQRYSFGGQVTEHKMPPEDREKVRHIIWELIIQSILVPGSDERNASLPFLRVTPYGKEVLAKGEIIPYDPDGYLRRLHEEIPNLDKIIDMYVVESLQTFLRGNLLSSIVMLGVASERAFILLLEALTNAITDVNEKQRFLGFQESIRTKYKFDQVKNKLNSIRISLPRELSDDLDSQLDGIFNLIRESRNDAGHPTGRKVERGVVFTNLQLFPRYCKRVYGLIEWLNNNKI